MEFDFNLTPEGVESHTANDTVDITTKEILKALEAYQGAVNVAKKGAGLFSIAKEFMKPGYIGTLLSVPEMAEFTQGVILEIKDYLKGLGVEDSPDDYNILLDHPGDNSITPADKTRSKINYPVYPSIKVPDQPLNIDFKFSGEDFLEKIKEIGPAIKEPIDNAMNEADKKIADSLREWQEDFIEKTLDLDSWEFDDPALDRTFSNDKNFEPISMNVNVDINKTGMSSTGMSAMGFAGNSYGSMGIMPWKGSENPLKRYMEPTFNLSDIEGSFLGSMFGISGLGGGMPDLSEMIMDGSWGTASGGGGFVGLLGGLFGMGGNQGDGLGGILGGMLGGTNGDATNPLKPLDDAIDSIIGKNGDLLGSFEESLGGIEGLGGQVADTLAGSFSDMGTTLIKSSLDYFAKLGGLTGLSAKAFASLKSMNPWTAMAAGAALMTISSQLKRLSSSVGSGTYTLR